MHSYCCIHSILQTRLLFCRYSQLMTFIKYNILYRMLINNNIDDYQFREDFHIENVFCTEKVEVIGHSAFAFCSNLKEVDLSRCQIRDLQYATFRSNFNLKKVKLPNTLKSIGVECFCRCYQLEAIEIPENVEIIEQRAFRWCTNLKDVSLPGNLKTIKCDAFFNCESIEELFIPSSVGVIERYAFRSCINLKKLSISRKTAEIDTLGIFPNCPNLKSITLRDD